MSGATQHQDLSFLAPPGSAADWRLTLLYDALRDAGAIAALPDTAAGIAGRLGLDPRATRVTLDAVTAWGAVVRDGDRYAMGPAAPDEDDAATLGLHARTMRRWCAEIDAKLRGAAPPPPDQTGMRPEWLDALAVGARRRGALLVDACLKAFPDARTVLDLGGGHGEHALEFSRRGLRATMQDRTPVVNHVRERGRVTGGVELFAGDFHEVLPHGPFDLVFCTGVTHTMDATHNKDLYRRLRGIVAPGGGLALSTFFRNRTRVSSIFAVQMLSGGQGGDTFSEEEYREWLTAAGFTPHEIVDVAPDVQALLPASIDG